MPEVSAMGGEGREDSGEEADMAQASGLKYEVVEGWEQLPKG